MEWTGYIAGMSTLGNMYGTLTRANRHHQLRSSIGCPMGESACPHNPVAAQGPHVGGAILEGRFDVDLDIGCRSGVPVPQNQTLLSGTDITARLFESSMSATRFCWYTCLEGVSVSHRVLWAGVQERSGVIRGWQRNGENPNPHIRTRSHPQPSPWDHPPRLDH